MKLFRIYIDRIVDEISNYNADIEDDTEKCLVFLITLNLLSYTFKNPAFAEEKEVRIVHTPLIFDHRGKNEIWGGVSEMKYRISSNKLTPYFELQFSDSKIVSPIAEIVIGPKANIDAYEISMFLSINGFGQTSYRMSRASYR